MRRLPTLFSAAVLVGSTACGSGGGLPEVTGPTAPRLEVDATEMRFVPSRIAVSAGDVPVVLHNIGRVIHDLRIEGKPTLLVEASPGKTSTATWRLDKDRYEIYCSIPGHRAAGMKGVLEVR